MSIKSAPYYWVECDRCGAKADYGDFSAMMDASQAVDLLGDDGWVTVKGKDGEMHFCPSCTVWSDDEDKFVVDTSPVDSREE